MTNKQEQPTSGNQTNGPMSPAPSGAQAGSSNSPTSTGKPNPQPGTGTGSPKPPNQAPEHQDGKKADQDRKAKPQQQQR